MNASRIIKLLAGLAVSATLCACGGGGGGGGGGVSSNGGGSAAVTDQGISYHPGSTDPATQSDDPNHLLKGRQVKLESGDTAYEMEFDRNGGVQVTRTTGGAPLGGTMSAYTYQPTSATTARAEFRITYNPAWEGSEGESETLVAVFSYASATSAACELQIGSVPVGQVPATVQLLP